MQNDKIDVKQILLKVALFLAMLVSSFISFISTFNLLATMDYGIDISSMYPIMRYTMPIILALIYYGLYHVYISLMRGSLNSRMAQFGKVISLDGLRYLIDPCMIFLALYVAIMQVIFLLFPLYENVLLTITKEVGVIIAIYMMHSRLTKKLDKIFDPVIYWSLQFSFAVLVVLV